VDWLTRFSLARIESHPSSLAQRVIRAYQQSSAQQSSGELWSMIFDRQKDLHDALMMGDEESVEATLSNPGNTDLFYGADNLFRDITECTAGDQTFAETYPLYIQDELKRLSQAIGAGLVWNPEGGSQFPQKQYPPSVSNDELFNFLDAEMGTAVRFPNPFPNERGLETPRGLISPRAMQAIYQAWLAVSLKALTRSPKVLEIGAGMGRTAYYARSFGVSDYTIVDLPMGNVGQAAFLVGALGPDSVWMISDHRRFQRGRIKICPTSWIDGRAERFGIILNADSLTEMDKDEATRYGEFICRSAEIFISINHEANEFVVANVIPKCHTRAIIRTPYPMRDGYVQEIYFLRPNSAAKAWRRRHNQTQG
jgi:hypothetical protein